MKEFVVYLLKFLSSDKHYVGFTENLIYIGLDLMMNVHKRDLKTRFRYRNTPEEEKRFTKTDIYRSQKKLKNINT